MNDVPVQSEKKNTKQTKTKQNKAKKTTTRAIKTIKGGKYYDKTRF
jgi:hypothetical protein